MTSEDKRLEQEIFSAQQNEDWEAFLQLSQQLWTRSASDNQLAIEYQIWQALKSIPAAKRDEMMAASDTSNALKGWLEFVQTTQLHPAWQKPALEDIERFNPDALYNQHLTQALVDQLLIPKKIHQVAVLLPLTGPYQSIGLQIRNGIIRNQLQNAPDTQLTFYNTAQTDQIESVYQSAKQNGADRIIGPLQKQNIEQLAKYADQSMIALNDVTAIPHFDFISNSEALQIATKLCRKHYRNIGILTSSNPSDSQLAIQISQLWKQEPGHKLTLKTYPAKHPRLREALGSVINETQSQARKNNLRWLLKEKLYFTPRTRQDLDAIVLLGNTQQVAVFQPQFEFFELKLPVYGSSKLTPAKLGSTAPNKDMENVIFPSFRAALIQTNLTSKLEAFGWDSFTLATKQYLLGPKICLNDGMTGRLSREENTFDYQLIWAKYNHKGIAVPLKKEEAPLFSDSKVATPETAQFVSANKEALPDLNE